MTGNTLEQRAVELLISAHKAHPNYTPRKPGDKTVELHAMMVEMLEAGKEVDSVARHAVKAALRLSAGADWVLVPREPTDDMVKAVYPYHYFTRLGVELREHWAAMLAAAPRHETGEG